MDTPLNKVSWNAHNYSRHTVDVSNKHPVTCKLLIIGTYLCTKSKIKLWQNRGTRIPRKGHRILLCSSQAILIAQSYRIHRDTKDLLREATQSIKPKESSLWQVRRANTKRRDDKIRYQWTGWECNKSSAGSFQELEPEREGAGGTD